MSQLKAAKDELLHAITAYNCAKSGLSTAVEQKSERALSVKLSKLEEALSRLNAAHTTWVAKSEFAPDALAAETHSPKWLKGVWTAHSILCDSAEEIISNISVASTPPTHNNNQKLSIYTKQMEALQHEISEKIDNLTEKCKSSVSASSHKVYVDIMDSVISSLGARYEQLSQNILLLDSANLDIILKQHTEFQQQYNTKLLDLQIVLAEKAPGSAVVGSAVIGSAVDGSSAIQMEKSKAPTFSGRTIDYPEFKRGWTKVAGKTWSDENQVEQIKLKVDEET